MNRSQLTNSLKNNNYLDERELFAKVTIDQNNVNAGSSSLLATIFIFIIGLFTGFLIFFWKKKDTKAYIYLTLNKDKLYVLSATANGNYKEVLGSHNVENVEFIRVDDPNTCHYYLKDAKTNAKLDFYFSQEDSEVYKFLNNSKLIKSATKEVEQIKSLKGIFSDVE